MVSKIKLARIVKGWSQLELARLIGTNQTRISMLERGLRPSKPEAAKLAKVLSISEKQISIHHEIDTLR